jgi:hypothetical protein
MDITFKYNGKIITTPNLEKKLKRMKISIDDIEIIDTPIIKKESKSGIEDYMLNKEQVIVKSKLDDIQRICYVDKGTRPPLTELFKKQVEWGIYTNDDIMNMYYDN